MRSIRRGNFICVLASLIVLALPMSAMARSVIWSSPWAIQAAPWVLPNSFVATGAPAFVTTAMAADGDVLIGGESFNQDFRIDRVTPGGGIRWSVHIPNVFYDWSGIGAMLPTADGGAFVTVGNPQYTSDTLLVRTGPDGSILWQSEESAWSLAMPTQQTVAIAGYGAVTEFDAITGSVLWQYANNGVLPSSVATDGVHVFAEVGNSTEVDAIELDSSGLVQWKVTVDNAATTAARLVAVSSGLVYLNTSTGVLALHARDGSTAWSALQATVVAMAGSPAEPIVAGNGVVQRLAAADGHAVWTQTFSGTVSFANFTAGEILVGSGNALTALNPDTGTVLWSATIPAQDGNGHSLQMVAAGTDGGSNINAVASAGYGQPVFLQPINSRTGQLQTPPAITATVAEGVYAAESVQEDSGHIASVALDWKSATPEIRVRRLDSGTGATLWETAQPLDGLYTPALPAIASGSGTIAAVVAQNKGVESSSSSIGSTWVGAFDDQTGNLRWQRYLLDLGPQYIPVQQYTNASAPAVDSAGDIYVAYGANISCATLQDPYCTNAQQTLVKLAAADGTTLWRFDNTSSGGQFQVFPQDFELAGNGVVVNGPFSGSLASYDAIDLNGGDGSILWKSGAFGGSGQGTFLPAPDGSLIGIGPNSWGKADAATGTLAWSNSRIARLSCTVGCNIYDYAVAPSGDYLAVGEADFMPFVDYLPATPGAMEKQWRLDSTYTGLRSLVRRVAADSAGAIWIQLNRFFRHGSGGIDILAHLDPVTGSMLSQQALTGFSEFPFPEQSIPLFLSAPKNDELEAFTFASGPPVSSTPGMAMIDTTVTAIGNLSIHVTADQAVAHPGDTIGFHVVADYGGSAPIAGAHVIADLSGLGIPTGLACAAQAASNCMLDSSLGQVTASFDVQPGGQIDISGQVTVSQTPENSLLPALVYGPTGLSEQDTLDNFATLSLTDEIFSNGF